MSKYLAVFKISWVNALVYRLNFTLWRVRSVLQLLLIYFVWWTVFQSQKEIFGYTESAMLSYIMVSALIRAIILSTRAMDVTNHINEGSVANFLVKPLGFISYYFTRDLADKLLNIAFVIVEIFLLTYFLQPKLIIQTDPMLLGLFLIAAILGVILYFTIAFTFGLLTFWVENAWGPIFLVTIFLEGFGGGLFPIDILPSGFAQLLLYTPFPYLIYFPAKLYLGDLPTATIFLGFSVLIFWIVMMYFIMISTLKAGFKTYTAVGH